MSKEPFRKIDLEQLLQDTKSQQQFSPEFIARLQNAFGQNLSQENFPVHLARKPSYSVEAHVISTVNFFNGKLEKVLEGEHLGDSLMKDLMIESSGNLYQWLLMRKIFRGKKYNTMTNLVAYTLPIHTSTWKPPEMSDEYKEILLPKLSSTLNLLKKPLRNTTKDFQVEIAALLENPSAIDVETVLSQPLTPRRNANVITAFCFRNTLLEDLHAGVIPPTEESFLNIQQESDHNLQNWLTMMDTIGETSLYKIITQKYWSAYCTNWEEGL